MGNDEKLKLCIIYNGAPHYRAGIFRLIDEEYDCEWFLGPMYGNIKQLPLSFFKNAHLQEVRPIYGAMHRQKGEVRTLLKKEYDAFLILGEIVNSSCWLGMILHNIFNKRRKVYYWSHGILRKRSWPRRSLDKLFFSMPYATFTYGERAKKVMIELGLDGDSIYPIHNSLDYESQIGLRGRFSDIYLDHFGNKNPVLLFIGRLTPIKELDLLVSAAAELRRKQSDVNIVFIGDGPVKEALQHQSECLGLTGSVWFYGPCYNEEEKSELIANADLCVAPGNVGLTAMDALMYGTPVATMDNFDKQMPEFESIKDGITGFFFKEHNLADLVTKIEGWLGSGMERAAIRQHCYDEIDSSWNPEYQLKIIKEHLLK